MSQPQAGAVSRSPAVRAGLVSLAASMVILAAKLAAYLYTGSMALLADAAESSVNVMAATVMTFSVAVSRRPPDASHPYGHGKAEPLSAAVEGALVGGAALFIAVEAFRRLMVGTALENLGLGMGISVAAALANLLLGLYLLGVGRRERSEALRADGLHVLSDTITTAASIAALVAVKLSGIALIDPAVALLVGANLLWAGWRVTRRSLTGLLDEADFALLGRIAKALEAVRRSEWCDIHQLRGRRVGPVAHVDLHLVVPRYLAIDEAHRVGDGLEAEIARAMDEDCDFVVHLDPCRRVHCPGCAVAPCPVRAAPLAKPVEWSVAHLTEPGPV